MTRASVPTCPSRLDPFDDTDLTRCDAPAVRRIVVVGVRGLTRPFDECAIHSARTERVLTKFHPSAVLTITVLRENAMPATPKEKKPLVPTIVVPALAHTKKCTCGKWIYFVMTTKGAPMPVDCSVADGITPHAATGRDGLGVTHFATCSDAKAYSQRGRK
jgi:hypothetical protein